MPRTTNITQENRTLAFLAWRRGGRKIYPVAKEFGVARSTVSGIVQTFLGQGFSDRPRANLSMETLRALQTAHLASIHQQLAPEIETSPFDLMQIRSLDLTSATNEANARDLLDIDPLQISDEFLWHLRETPAAPVIEESREASRDFHRRDHASWDGLRQALETYCGLPVVEESVTTEKPHLVQAFVSQIRNTFFDPKLPPQEFPERWPKWSKDRNEAKFLLADGHRAAFGDEEDHLRVKNGVSSFLTSAYQDHRTRFSEVERLRQDLLLLQNLLNEALRDIAVEQIRSGICPACPFPEGTHSPGEAAVPKKPTTTGRG